MYRILEKLDLAPNVKKYVIEAPLVAAKVEPGQFVVIRVCEKGERIPLTVSDFDRQRGTITLVVQEVGKTTRHMGTLNAGDSLPDVLGPLGTPAKIEKCGTVICAAGGVGGAIVYPEARKHAQVGNRVITVMGARTKDLIFYSDEFESVSERVLYSTDDGSFGHHGFVTDLVKQVIEQEKGQIAEVVAIGPIPMMKAVCDVTRPYGIRTIVSLNPIMIDGTGMCGACRVTVGGETRFCCTDGPEFDGHLVDFDELMNRSKQYAEYEKESLKVFEHSRGCAGACHGK